MSKKIVLKSSDGETFEVEEAVALQSQTVAAHMVEDSCVGNEIPLENVTGQILAKVIEYCKKHVVVDGDGVSSEELKNWDAEFMKNMDQSTLFHLILAADYLNIESLLDLTCETVVRVIETKTVEEIRTFFSAENDYTPEEEAQFRKENSWAVDD
ncbi:hypothetical protein EUTSA_v10012113mg [Eutrema salsugineum]|uniref:SKP1-like protein n=1 Tax=Eutrema salsugineum TaxID=72664 RepID=V4KTE1_EUTSA|nr:SKP1-like protein 1A [Eutrema salsugineum]ESQ30628.1 hypothetical protein EUTSA_v10012113mg [Eutrema salsugineum]